jgi:homoserine O-acetyltransferase
MAPAATIKEDASIEEAARVMIDNKVTHLPVIDVDGCLAGIVTAWDISKAVALKYAFLDQIMSKNVMTIRMCDSVEAAAAKMEKHDISALPVIDDGQHVLGIVTSDSMSRLIGQRKSCP